MRCAIALVLTELLLGAGCTSESLEPAPTGDGGSSPSYEEPYTITAFDRARIGSQPREPGFHEVTADIELTGPVASALLVIDLDTTCWPFEKWADNPPPPGHNWPADCDAFDRNFEWSLDPPLTEADAPAIELVRAITPFGGPRHLEVDITDVVNGVEPGEHRLRAHISTWSDGAGQVSGSNGGWFVSGRIDVTPGPPPRNVLAVIPIYDRSFGPSDAPGPQSFLVPEGTRSGRIEYRVTGHGGGSGGFGCIGPAEEFCQREHTLRIDGAELTTLHPWRTDCAIFCTLAHQESSSGGFDYCLENPCGAIASVRAPRANWCPSDITLPFLLEPVLAPGEHTVAWEVSTIAEGGSWRTSAVYFALGE